MTFTPGALCVIGGVLAVIGGLVGSSIGIAKAASAGTATLAEDRTQFRNVIVLASLPMTQSFYGLIVLLLIITTAIPNLPKECLSPGATLGPGVYCGVAVLGCGVIAAAAEFFSAVYQGSVCASGISLLPKTKGLIFTPAMMLAVFVELLGVLGLVFTIMTLALLGLM